MLTSQAHDEIGLDQNNNILIVSSKFEPQASLVIDIFQRLYLHIRFLLIVKCSSPRCFLDNGRKYLILSLKHSNVVYDLRELSLVNFLQLQMQINGFMEHFNSPFYAHISLSLVQKALAYVCLNKSKKGKRFTLINVSKCPVIVILVINSLDAFYFYF